MIEIDGKFKHLEVSKTIMAGTGYHEPSSMLELLKYIENNNFLVDDNRRYISTIYVDIEDVNGNLTYPSFAIHLYDVNVKKDLVSHIKMYKRIYTINKLLEIDI